MLVSCKAPENGADVTTSDPHLSTLPLRVYRLTIALSMPSKNNNNNNNKERYCGHDDDDDEEEDFQCDSPDVTGRVEEEEGEEDGVSKRTKVLFACLDATLNLSLHPPTPIIIASSSKNVGDNNQKQNHHDRDKNTRNDNNAHEKGRRVVDHLHTLCISGEQANGALDAPIIAHLIDTFPSLFFATPPASLSPDGNRAGGDGTPPPKLKNLRIRCNTYDEGDSAAAVLLASMGSSALETLSVRWCDLSSIRLSSGSRPSSTSAALKTLDLRGCQSFTSLDGLVIKNALNDDDDGGNERGEDGEGRSSSTPFMFLEDINLSWTAVASLRPLQLLCSGGGGSRLRKVDISGGLVLTSLEGLEGHEFLERLDASDTSITSLQPLRWCLRLKTLNLRGCQDLFSSSSASSASTNTGTLFSAVDALEGLEHHHALEEINVADTPIRSLKTLASCRGLKKVFARNCEKLATLAGLEDHLDLTEINVTDTVIDSLVPLKGCLNLEKIYVRNCEALTSLEGLEDLRRLQEVDATNAPMIPTLLPLRHCRALRVVLLTGSQTLKSLEGLEDHLFLEQIDVSDTAISTVEALQLQSYGRTDIVTSIHYDGRRSGGSYLRIIDLNGCAALSSLAFLEGGYVHLEELDASWTAVDSLRPLAHCPKLKKISMRCCEALSSLDGLRNLSMLEDLNATETPIRTLRHHLSGCAGALRRLTLRNCQELSSLEGLEGHVFLEEIDVSYSAIRSIYPIVFYNNNNNKTLHDSNTATQMTVEQESIVPVKSALRCLYLNRCAQLTTLDGNERQQKLPTEEREEEEEEEEEEVVINKEGIAAEENESSSKNTIRHHHTYSSHHNTSTCSDWLLCDHIEDLDAAFSAITSVRALAGSCQRSLRTVSFWGCEQLSSLDGLEHHPMLEEVNVSGTPIPSLRPLQVGCSRLQVVDVRGCEQLSSDVLSQHGFSKNVKIAR